jgi:hypothetical protein
MDAGFGLWLFAMSVGAGLLLCMVGGIHRGAFLADADKVLEPVQITSDSGSERRVMDPGNRYMRYRRTNLKDPPINQRT